jgi:hydrocephalus-inducing protein
LKKLTVPIKGKTEFPSLSSQPKVIFGNNIKKKRPTTVPECYLSKSFIQSENVFDFGPLLIGKSVDKKNEKEMMSVNSTVFKFLNSGPFTTEVEFAFLSSIIEGKPEYNKNVFSLSAERVSIEPGNTPSELRVWGIPIEAR